MLKYLKGNVYIALMLRLLIIFLLYTISRALFLLFNLSNFPGLHFEELVRIFLGGLKFDLSAILYLNLLFILSQILPFPFVYSRNYQKTFKWVFFVTNAIGLAANAGDIVYYPFTLKRTTFSAFAQFSNEENLGSLFIKFIFIDYWYITLLYIAMLALMVWLYKRIKTQKPNIPSKILYYSSSVGIMLLLAWFCVAGLRGGFRHSTRPITVSNAGEFVKDPAQINIVINTPFSVIRTISTKPLKKRDYFNQATLDSIYNPVKLPDTSQAFNKKNVVVLVLESFSREYIGAFNPTLEGGKYKGYAPFLDSLKSVSLSFNNAYANGRKSIEGLPSVIASIPGINEPFVLGYYSGNRINSLGGLLGKEGYHTSFFHGAPNGSMGFSSFINMAGIKHYYGKTEYNNDADFDGIWGIWDEPFLQFWANKMNTFPQPFFSNVFTLSSHHPFKVPEKYEGKFPKGTLPIHQNIGYSDMALRKFFQTASKMPWYKNTIFVLTADHSTVAWHDEYKTSIGAYAVPIIIFDPSGELKGQIDAPVQQIDIFPTIMNYLHYPKPYFAFGNDMLNPKEHFVINTIDGDYQIMVGDYVMLSRDGKAIKLYNYREDILLKNNLLKQEPLLVAKMERYLKAFIQQYNAHMIDNSLTVKRR
ncbi:sulfatase [Pelobium manganitolerans]|uniref:Sulfatase n=1 Tax=Pelobium manganitolerans TaxID=1842495 RepID=A0A419S6Y1_9SPHI|nr:alkaline phosphatase family protein [Pelobium manganitolerans]RKD17074.1 sulfatase [Pelobium manganitolerans]